MKILFDTNVIIDLLTSRDLEQYKYAHYLLRKILNKNAVGFIVSKQITDIAYILKKYVSSENISNCLNMIIETFEILPFAKSDIKETLKNQNTSKDFEDAVLEEMAKVYKIDYIVTNNLNDFINNQSICISPKNLSILLSANDN